MVTRRDLIKMGILSSGGFVLLPAGGGFGRVSSFFSSNQFGSPRLTPFVDPLPVPAAAGLDPSLGGLVPLTERAQFPINTIASYARPYYGVDTTTVKGTRCFEISAVERTGEVKFHRDLPKAPSVWAYIDTNNRTLQSNRLITFHFPPNATLVGQPRFKGMLVRHHNELNCAPRDFGCPFLTVHFHGGHQPSPADGFPADIANRPLISTSPAAFFPEHVVICPQDRICPVNQVQVSPFCPPDTPGVCRPPVVPPLSPQVFDYMYPLTDVGLQDFVSGRSKEPPTTHDRPAFLWFHDHILDFTRTNVYRGLANVVPVFDDPNSDTPNAQFLDTGNEGTGLRLPSGAHDLFLVVQDKIFDISGALIFDPFNGDGFLGDTFLVNGVVQPFHVVQRRKYRLRFLNGSNARIYEIFLTDDSRRTYPMTQIATEGGLLQHPIPGVQHFTLAMAERYEVIVDFADSVFDGVANIYVENRMAQTEGRKPDDIVSQGPKLLQFRLTGPKITTPPVPSTLRFRPPVDPADIARATHRSIKMDRSHGVFTINGEPIDIERPISRSTSGQPEIWHIENSSGGWWHPNHIHSEFQRVLKRNGRTPSAIENGATGNALKDTVLLRGGDSVDVLLTFRDFLGPFVSHCHNIEHEDMAMMARFDVVP